MYVHPLDGPDRFTATYLADGDTATSSGRRFGEPL